MLDMKINNGKFIIDDNNNVRVDEQTKKQIEEAFEDNKDNEDKKKPDMTVED